MSTWPMAMSSLVFGCLDVLLPRSYCGNPAIRNAKNMGDVDLLEEILEG